jgi:hypothetical protein
MLGLKKIKNHLGHLIILFTAVSSSPLAFSLPPGDPRRPALRGCWGGTTEPADAARREGGGSSLPGDPLSPSCPLYRRRFDRVAVGQNGDAGAGGEEVVPRGIWGGRRLGKNEEGRRNLGASAAIIWGIGGYRVARRSRMPAVGEEGGRALRLGASAA